MYHFAVISKCLIGFVDIKEKQLSLSLSAIEGKTHLKPVVVRTVVLQTGLLYQNRYAICRSL